MELTAYIGGKTKWDYQLQKRVRAYSRIEKFEVDIPISQFNEFYKEVNSYAQKMFPFHVSVSWFLAQAKFEVKIGGRKIAEIIYEKPLQNK